MGPHAVPDRVCGGRNQGVNMEQKMAKKKFFLQAR